VKAWAVVKNGFLLRLALRRMQATWTLGAGEQLIVVTVTYDVPEKKTGRIV